VANGREPDCSHPSDKAPNIGHAECEQPVARKPRGFREALLDALRRSAELSCRAHERGKQESRIQIQSNERAQVRSNNQTIGLDRI
jgi:hypothetical protein